MAPEGRITAGAPPELEPTVAPPEPEPIVVAEPVPLPCGLKLDPPLGRLLMLEFADPPLADEVEFIDESRELFPLPQATRSKPTTDPQPKGFKMRRNILGS